MQCPKCDGDMETVSEEGFEAIRIDRCRDCHGLYFDQLTRQDLPRVEVLTELDTGDEEMGAEYNKMVYVECPKCDKIMDQRVAEGGEVRIRFELCVSCHSTFLDAGELRQYLSDNCRADFEALLPAQ